MRTFIAVELNREARSIVNKYIDSLGEYIKDVKWVAEENLHITIKFLGEIKENELSKLKENVEKTAAIFGPFVLTLADTGFFPGEKAARVVWIGADGGIDHLLELFQELENNLEQIGFDREEKTFSPHLTIGRAKRDKKIIVNDNFPEFDSITIDVKSISIMKSTLTPDGPIYERIFKTDFKKPPVKSFYDEIDVSNEVV
jgi:RNA 2',3'-cyclic 3'-phosphodiesterase